ncbi:MAG TPA: UDP-forming cellulose synthase catalytic subunit [Acidobacteriaceae bacterium]
MTRSALWKEFESGDTRLLRVLRFVILAGGVFFLGFTAMLDLNWRHQLVLALLTVALAIWAHRSSTSYVVTLTLMLLSVYSTARYAFWRFSTVAGMFRDPAGNWTALDGFFVCLVLFAEAYAFVVLLLGYVQTMWPLRRVPAPLPNDPEDWPAVDLLIPTYTEPLSVVRFTALASLNIDWPADKLNVYILDDGKREEFRAFAEEAGIGYMTRDDNRHAKAGNLNHALERLSAPFVAVFDCDHVPTRSFLQVTMGWFLRDQKLAVLQTPQHSYSPDPFERNLDLFHSVPNEDELFYSVVQDGNDFWNATSFCGSCAVLRRKALDDAGGLAVETVTEDAHTSLRLQMRGWNTAYINIPQAAGLATERLSGHVKQRIRWARGMVQTLRLENPLLAPGLTWAQRLCYFNAMLHFLYALPRLIFLTAPVIYLVFGRVSIPGLWMAIVAYGLPHLVLSNLANSRIQGEHRHSFWNEIYETVLAPYIFFPTLVALIWPRSGRFNVTAKGGVVSEDYFDSRVARPFLVLLAINCFGLLCAAARSFQLPAWDVAGWLAFVNWPASLYDGQHAGTVWVNVAWTLFNLAVLGVATAVAWESQQRRTSVRVALSVPSDVILPDGAMLQGVTSDLSSGGVRTTLDHAVKASVGDAVKFVFPLLDGSATLPAKVVGIVGNELRAQFDSLSLQEDEALTMLLYSRADTWLGLAQAREADRPMRSLGRILRLSIRGLSQTVFGSRKRKSASKGRLLTSVVPVVVLGLLGGLAAETARAAQTGPANTLAESAQSTGAFDDVVSLADMGARDAIHLQGVQAAATIRFRVARNRTVKTAALKLRYHFSPGLLPTISHLNVSLNGTLFATETVNAAVAAPAGQSAMLESTVSVPAELVRQENQIRFEFVGHYGQQCEDPANSTLWAQVDPTSAIELTGTLQAPVNDLSMLPAPFRELGVNPQPVVPVVFLTRPSLKAIHAAGIIASWLGAVDSRRPVRFAVSVGTIPAGNAIVIAENAAAIPASLGVSSLSGATVAIATNPSDVTSSVLLVAGQNADELVGAAMALPLHGDTWQGRWATVPDLTLPAARGVDDAPLWTSSEDFGKLAGVEDLQGDGSVPLNVTMRVPPDLFYGEKQNLPFHLSYRYNGIPLGKDSTLQVYVNGAFVSSTPMPHSDNASSELETVVPVPVTDLQPFTNTMTLKFAFQPATREHCEQAEPMNLQGAVLGDSRLDLTDVQHMTTLPNLRLFANAGYPFTRRADLAETSVVLPDEPTAPELEMFLAMMGHFGAQTGYPALRVTVTNAAGMTKDGSRDYLVMGAAADQPALAMLNSALPVGVRAGGLEIHDTRGLLDRAAWWRSAGSDHVDAGGLGSEGGLPDALVQGIEWPAGSGRTVVTVVVRDAAAIPGFVSAFLEAAPGGGIAKSMSVLHGAEFSSYRVGGDAYRVGDISPMMRMTIVFQEYPWLIAIVAAVLCFLIAVMMRAKLRRRARERLQGE